MGAKTKIQITLKEYKLLLSIAFGTDIFLRLNDPLTRQRLTDYIKEFNKQ